MSPRERGSYFASLRRFLRGFLPKYCVVCGDLSGEQICPDCLDDRLERIDTSCGNCGKPLLSGEIDGMCGNCGEMDLRWDSAHSLFAYTEPARDFLHAAKYENQVGVIEDLLDLMLERAPGGLEGREFLGIDPLRLDGLVPVPMYWRKGMARSFNQAEVISEWLGRKFDLPVLTEVIAKVRETESQAGLSRNQRQQNLRGAFELTEESRELDCTRLAVVDDLVTTGATMTEVCKTISNLDGLKSLHIFSVFTTDLRYR